MFKETRDPCPVCGGYCGFHSKGSGIVVKQDKIGETEKMLTLDQRYYVNRDKTRAMSEEEVNAQKTSVGDEGHFEPAFLLGGPGALISEEDAEKLGLTDLEEHDLTANATVNRAMLGVPNRADLSVAQVLPDTRTALQKVGDAVRESENPDEKRSDVEQTRQFLGVVEKSPRANRAARRETRAREEANEQQQS